MKAINKIKLKIFLIKCIFEIIVNGTILSIVFLSDRLFETLLFYICWFAFRKCVPKIFHVKRLRSPLMNIVGCLFLSVFCFIIAMKLMLPIEISIFSSVLVGIFINYCLYKIEDYIELKEQIAQKVKDIYSMNEEELRCYARKKHLSEMMIDTLVLKVIHNYKWVEIQQERNYSKTAIIYHKKQICKVLNIEL